jgi:hypothetical protein
VVKEVGKNIECVVSEWSVWKECRVKWGVGIKERLRMIKVKNENGGRKCKKSLVRRKKWKMGKWSK